MSVQSMRQLEFQNGDEMPAIGLGTWKSSRKIVADAVYKAIKMGYRHIDCAANYGNEEEVGKGIRKALKHDLVEREDLWITSKLWNDSHRKRHVQPALEQTLEDLQLDYLDLYLVHWPVAIKKGADFPLKVEDMISLDEVPLTRTWYGMEEIRDNGMSRHIGVSNFNEQKIYTLFDECNIAPEVNQIELHPYLQQDQLISFCHSHNVHVTAYSPLGSGDRDNSMKRDDEPSLLDDETIGDIADKHDCSPAQILIAWSVHRGTAVIPKSTDEKHLRENLEAANISLDKEDIRTIADLDRGYRYVDGSFFAVEGSSYSKEKIWNG